MDNRSNEYISEALRIADDLMESADNGAGPVDESGFVIVFGLIRDCAYKIRRYPEHEGHKAQRDFLRSKAMLVIFAAAVLTIMFAPPANATIILSTDATETLGALTFIDDDLAEYNPTTDTATLFFDGSLFSGAENIDAVHVLANGNIILSTENDAMLGGLTFEDGDLVEYNPTTDTATLYFDQDLFSQAENTNATYILDNGNIILSTVDNARLGGLNLGYEDLVEYNPTTDVATLFLDGSLFSEAENIDAAHVLANGNIILSTVDEATLGGLSFGAADLAEYNPTTDVATLYFDGNLFSGPGASPNVDAVYVTTLPEPATTALLGLGCLALIGRKRG